MIRYFIIALIILFLDQLTKKIILATIPYRGSLEIFFWLDLVHIYNRGAAFSLFASAEWSNIFLLTVGILAILFLSFWLFRSEHKEVWHDRLAIAFILGGASGNIADRLQFGYVVDFISVHYKNWYYPSFNVADSAITLGVTLLLLGLLYRNGHKKKQTIDNGKP